MDLSRNHFNNSFPSDFDYFSNSSFLRYLDLSRNQFSGSYPHLFNTNSDLTFASFAYNRFTGDSPKNLSKGYFFGNPSCELDSSSNCEDVSVGYQSPFPSIQNITDCTFFESSDFYQKCNVCMCGVDPLSATIKVYDLILGELNYYIPYFENIWDGSISSQQVLVRSITNLYTSYFVRLEIYMLNTSENVASQKMHIRDALKNKVGKGFYLDDFDSDLGKYHMIRMEEDIPIKNKSIGVRTNTRKNDDKTIMIIVITLSISAVIILAIIAYTFFVVHKIKKEAQTHSVLEKQLDKKFLQKFSLADVKHATNNFNDEHLLGSGGFASVYKGVTPEGEVWAVKRSKLGSTVTLESFQKEVLTISKISHFHLVKLLGFCDEMDEKIFIYEFVHNGTLRSHLSPQNHAEGKNPMLSFEQRLDIALDSAEGLNYLHSFAQPPIVHRDIKSENILLDSDLRAKLADFGLAKFASPTSTNSSSKFSKTNVVGTFGYMDPEYFRTGIVSFKSDVYSFGVVLLELITGKPLIFASKMKEGNEFLKVSLASWSIPYIDARDMANLVDPLLGNDCDMVVAFNIARIAAKCLERQSNLRPPMEEVVLVLRTLLKLDK